VGRFRAFVKAGQDESEARRLRAQARIPLTPDRGGLGVEM